MTDEKTKYTNSQFIPKELLRFVDNTIKIVNNSTTDYLKVRKEIIKISSPRLRSLFRARHYSTMGIILCELDYHIINYWHEKTGTWLVIDKTKLHPLDWVPKGRSYTFLKYNEQKRREKALSNNIHTQCLADKK